MVLESFLNRPVFTNFTFQNDALLKDFILQLHNKKRNLLSTKTKDQKSIPLAMPIKKMVKISTVFIVSFNISFQSNNFIQNIYQNFIFIQTFLSLLYFTLAILFLKNVDMTYKNIIVNLLKTWNATLSKNAQVSVNACEILQPNDTQNFILSSFVTTNSNNTHSTIYKSLGVKLQEAINNQWAGTQNGFNLTNLATYTKAAPFIKVIAAAFLPQNLIHEV